MRCELRAEVSRSRLGRLQVTGGTAVGTLEGERLTYDFALHTRAARWRSPAPAPHSRPRPNTRSVAAASRPSTWVRGSAAPIWRPRSTPGSRPPSRPAPETACGPAVIVDLLPSTVNQARLDAGRADLSVERGALAGELRAQGADAEVMARLAGTLGQQSRVRTDGTLRVEHLARWTGEPPRRRSNGGEVRSRGGGGQRGSLQRGRYAHRRRRSRRGSESSSFTSALAPTPGKARARHPDPPVQRRQPRRLRPARAPR